MEDDASLLEWTKQRGDKYLRYDIQNELMSIMALQLQRGLAADIRCGYYSIIADEYCDISNKEQLNMLTMGRHEQPL